MVTINIMTPFGTFEWSCRTAHAASMGAEVQQTLLSCYSIHWSFGNAFNENAQTSCC